MGRKWRDGKRRGVGKEQKTLNPKVAGKHLIISNVVVAYGLELETYFGLECHSLVSCHS